ncbi:hypothetical protein [Oceanisphaera avium]|uniref:hypothetical protein n=1 Tax=Oceanisphaera avium TaxID=1903694 RepID=UPI0012F8AFA1|nr:hypothetical protein [Oceanisphaera avium]
MRASYLAQSPHNSRRRLVRRQTMDRRDLLRGEPPYQASRRQLARRVNDTL